MAKAKNDERLQIRCPKETKDAMVADAESRQQDISQFVRWMYGMWVEAGKPDRIRKG